MVESQTIHTRRLPVDRERPDPAVIAEAAAILRAGGVVAFPTETVYGLAAVITDDAAVRRVFAVKGRPEGKPLIAHLARVEQVALVARAVPPVARELMARFFPGPLTLVLPRRPELPDSVTAGGDTVAVRMPDHAVARALIEAVGVPLAAPSANRSGARSAVSADDVMADLGGRIELVLDAGPARLQVPSTVVDLTVEPPRVVRHGAVPAVALRPYLPNLSD
ncbi:MAG: threonylcarbamoyl-AMP synthase [Armatimonadetes bacterium]|jgi:L-threonylcarbamoyladenylate synthase|nr:threonylcarbamoyl-AMP synthase [Armatimonadota bacterium]